MDSVNDDAKGVGYRRIEVLTGPGRRRRWSDDDKARIVAETAQPGAVVCEVARRWQVSPQQVFDWRGRARKVLAAAQLPTMPAFVPIVPQTPIAEPVAPPARPTPPVEVKLAGAVLRIAPGTDTELLTAVLRAIRVSAAWSRCRLARGSCWRPSRSISGRARTAWRRWRRRSWTPIRSPARCWSFDQSGRTG